MNGNDNVKAGREFQTIKDTGVKAQMEGVKWLPATTHFLPTLENDKQAYQRQLKNECSPTVWFQQSFFS